MERGMTADQMLSALWRRKALVGAIAAAIFVLGAAIVMTRPSIYEASVVVRVEPQRPGEEMVQRTVSELIEQRLVTVRQELLARPVLQKAIEEMNLYPELVSEKGIEAAVEQMRKDLTVRVEGETAFELTYAGRDPQVVAQVANRLPAIFSEETLKIRQTQAARATDLFTEEMVAMGKAVSSWEGKISKFKVDHLGELPEQMEMNMRGLERISAQLQTKSEELRTAEARRSDLARARNAADSEAGRLEAAESGLSRTLTQAKTQWTPDHPEVKRMERELGDISTQRKDAEGRMFAERNERTRVSTLITNIQKDIVDLQKQAEAYQARLNNTPRWAQELAVMNRDYEIARTKYQSVVSRKVEAEIAQELEAKSAKSLFNVISPAGAPSSPARPDRMSGLLIAALVALALGVLTGTVLEMRDDSLRDGTEVRERITLPVLAVVPNMQGKTEKRILMPMAGSKNSVSSPTSLN
ncbi:chain-length determining protein [Corallococcus exercitus]|uniref:Chain-length determining protein n=1 Tax=Corallococcus exercitus TaxID=2316736 RepID=A0A3A8ISS6_9BACT|nr:Wzz/FepE/Etk N-terminal domain-containing protein [Corallococcus exercitus]NOK35568.1 chain-length determining protein [Corallococcus exercitus]RKG81351.1 chain-length determining protein [Corallococcus exercitus]